MRAFLGDVRLALRGFRKEPRFVTIAALTLALGIGSVTSIFSVVNGVLLKPLPYRDAERLTNIWSNAAGLNLDQFPLSPDLFVFFRDDTRSFDDMAISQRREANLNDDASPEVVDALITSASYFTTFGIAPAQGQLFTKTHDTRGATLAVVISDRLWHRRFGGDRGAVGRTVQVDGEAATILGILPPELDDNGSPDVWIPTRFDWANPVTGTFGWYVAARLKPGVTPEAAQAEFVPLVKKLTEGGISAPDYRAFLTNGRYQVLVHSLREDVVGDLRQPLWILLGTVGFVLLIACANVANLFLIRAEARQKEVAVRAALGATRAALVRKQLTEAVVLAAIGGGLGVGLAAVGVPALIRVAPPNIPRLAAVGIDPLVIVVALGTTLVAALIFGIVPAFRYTRLRALAALRHGGRGATVDRSRHRGRQFLVVVQTALTLVLLIGSGLLVRSFSHMLRADLGFDATDVMTFRVALPRSSYADGAKVRDFTSRLLESLRNTAGVTAAGAASVLPMAGSAPGTAFVIDGQPTPPGQLPPIIHYKIAAPGYVEAMGLRLAQGRAFDSRDLGAAGRDILINQVMARRFWPGADPIGKRLRPSGDDSDAWYTVAGVVSSERQDGFREELPALIYFPLGAPISEVNSRTLAYVVKSSRVTRDAAALRSAVWALDPRLPVAAVQTMSEVMSRSIVPFTFTMLTLGLAAAMALLLGAVGLYGVLSYTVTLREREIGVRLALGAQPARIMRTVVAQGAGIVAIGLVAGLAGAYGLTRLLADLLFDTPQLDVTTFALTALALFAVAMLATYLPARRAAGVSPLESLRSE
jgi:predicted permease